MAHFVWNAEEQALTKMSEYRLKHLGEEYTDREIQEALKTYGDVDVDMFWELYKKFQKEKSTIKQIGKRWDGSIEFNTNSFKAWRKRNKDLFNSSFGWEYNSFRLCGYGNEIHLSDGLSYETIDKKFREAFSSLVYELKRKEYAWFRDHDEYSIIEDETIQLHQDYSFPHSYENLHLSFGTSGILVWQDADDEPNKEVSRKPTLDELKQLNEYYKKVKEAIESVPVPFIK